MQTLQSTAGGQRLEDDIGLYYYGARWSPGSAPGTGDLAAGRFIQADTIIPQQGVQGWDRYAYVNNNPIKYIDPSGNGMCDERWADPEDCKDADPNGDGIVLTDPSQTSQELVDQAIQDGYDQDDIQRGLDIFNALKGKSGWWDLYIDWNDPESVWRFILALAFTYETYSLRREQIFISQMITAFSSQFWDLMDKYGNAGGLIYAGTMQTLNERVGTLFNDIDTLNLNPYLEQVLGNTVITIVSKSGQSRASNAPYDFGVCIGGCAYTIGTRIDQAIWLSWDEVAYIRSRSQFYSGK
jgi:RHS repeat-associated protein